LGLVLLACSDSTFTGPTPVTTTTTSAPVEHPRVDQPFSWDSYQGIIAFGLGHPGQSEDDVLAFVSAAMGQGWNTFQVCSETEFWDGSHAYPTKPRDEVRLYDTLNLLARVPGAQVVLIGNCTLKRQVSLFDQAEWARNVATIASEFRNVAIFTHNEFDNCRGRDDWGGNPTYCAGKQDVAEHIRIYRGAGIAYVTADDSFRPPKPGDSASLTYDFRLRNIGAYPASFHPDRTKDGHAWDPSPNQLQQLARHNGLFVLSETVAWADFSGQCGGLRTCDQGRIDAYIASCAAVPECRFTFHCEHCLNGEVPTYIPKAR
ncbi:MAG: hypothetical protein ACREYE_03460, partial [Gammaproteobacteria bacterium]